MQKTLAITFVSLFALPLFAAKITNPGCSDLNRVTDQLTPEYMAVIDGYDKSGKKVGEEVDFGEIVRQTTGVKKECLTKTEEPLKEAKRQVLKSPNQLKSASTDQARLNPVTAKCEDFLALSETYQPVAVFWTVGHTKSGKVKDGEMDEAILSRPVATLVEDCKANPKTSFYARAKTWIKKTL